MKQQQLIGALLLSGFLLGITGCGQVKSKRSSQASSSHSSQQRAAAITSASLTSTGVSPTVSAPFATASAAGITAPTTQPSNANQSSSQSGVVVHNAEEALALAESIYGDDNGDYQWVIMSQSDGQPAQNEDGSYFVKAISKQAMVEGSMTGTALSLRVYPNGTIISN